MSRASRHIIVRNDPTQMGRTRGEHAENLRKEGWGAGLSAEQEDKCRYLERERGIKDRFLKLQDIDEAQ